MPQRKIHNLKPVKANAEARAKRAMNLAMLPLATLAISGCSSMGTMPQGSANDQQALIKVEETITKARGVGNSTPQTATPASTNDAAMKYAQAVDAALNAQPQTNAPKIDPAKKPAVQIATATTPPAKPAASASTVAPASPTTPTKPPSSVSMYVAPVEPKAAAGHAEEPAKPVAKVDSHAVDAHADDHAEPVKTEAKVEPKAEAKVEAAAPEHIDLHDEHVEPKSPVKTEAKVETKIEPKSEVKTEAKQPKLASVSVSETKIEKVEKVEKTGNAEPAAIAAAMPELKGASAMGAMTVTTPAVDEHLSIAGPVEPDVTMEAIVEQLRKQVKANPRQLNVALALSLLEGTSAEHANETAASPLSETDQKIVGSITSAVSAVMQTPANASLSEKSAPLVAAGRKLEGDGDLQLPKLVLTSRVDSYGVYSPVPNQFAGGRRHNVIIYCEVANFSSKKDSDGMYTTVLSQQDSLITEDGLLVWRPNPEEVPDRSRNQRHDFYLVKKLTLPETLALGKYTLRMSVTDKLTNKISMVSIPVEIVDAKQLQN